MFKKTWFFYFFIIVFCSLLLGGIYYQYQALHRLAFPPSTSATHLYAYNELVAVLILALFFFLVIWSWGRQKRLMHEAKIGFQETILQLTQELELKKKEVELLALKTHQATKAKSDFLANMSHEIRTPMNAIFGFSELLRETTLDDRQKEYVRIISSNGNWLLGIINDILDFSMLESGNVKLDKVDFNLEYLLTESFKMILPRLREKGLDSYLRIDRDVPLLLKGDPAKIKQVVNNLLGNAIKFTEKGCIGMTVRLISAAGQKVRLNFHVIDSGIGISQENIKKLFTPFTQADESTTRKFGGTGLGLTICKSLIEAMDGRIWIESTEGQGSHFIFEAEFDQGIAVGERSIQPLPLDGLKGDNVLAADGHAQLSDNKAPGEKIPLARPIAEEAGCKGLSVLVVDDVKANQVLLKAFLKILGCESFFLENGQQAVDHLRENLSKYDLCLMDLQMPVLSGDEATKIIRKELSGDFPIIALTAAALNEDRQKCFDAGMNDYLTKPLNLTDLKGVLLKNKKKSF